MKNFDLIASGWDNPGRLSMVQDICSYISVVSDLEKNLRIVDIGAGTGMFGLSLVEYAAHLCFVDTSAGMLKELERKLSTVELESVNTLLHDISSGKIPDEQPFDLAVSLLAFHHIEETGKALTAIRESLKPGGKLFLVDLDKEDGTFHGSSEGIPHLGFDRKDLASAAETAGFSKTEFSTPYTMVRQREGIEKEYPLFLMTAVN